MDPLLTKRINKYFMESENWCVDCWMGLMVWIVKLLGQWRGKQSRPIGSLYVHGFGGIVNGFGLSFYKYQRAFVAVEHRSRNFSAFEGSLSFSCLFCTNAYIYVFSGELMRVRRGESGQFESNGERAQGRAARGGFAVRSGCGFGRRKCEEK